MGEALMRISKLQLGSLLFGAKAATHDVLEVTDGGSFITIKVTGPDIPEDAQLVRVVKSEDAEFVIAASFA